MKTALSPLLLVVLVLIPPLTEAQADPPPCTNNTCPLERPICLLNDNRNRCFCPAQTYGDSCEQTCGGNLTATTTPSFLTSPGFPARYPEYLLCTWNILAPAGFEVKLTFNFFELENSSGCLNDVVRINGVNNYCDDILPPPTTASSITVFFRSDYDSVYDGFNATYIAREIDECQSSPCQNGGTCQDGDNSFTCTCAAGFSGPQCQEVIYTLTYCIARGGRGLALGAPPAVTLTLTGSAGSAGPVTLTHSSFRPDMCSSVTLTSTAIGAIQKAEVTATGVHGNQKTSLWNLAVTGAGQSCRFLNTELFKGQTKTLAASC